MAKHVSDFVVAESKKLHLSDGKWIEVKKELTVGEDRAMRTRGMGSFEPASDGKDKSSMKVQVDWGEFSIAQVCTYLIDWNFTDHAGKTVPVSEDAVRNMKQSRFDEITDVLQAHIEEMAAEKKEEASTGKSSPTKISA